MAGINGNTVLMLHMNGSDGSTTFTDDSPSAHVGTPSGTAQIDTSESYFGGASGQFDGSSACAITYADSPDWNFGSGDFTIDFWLRPNTLGGTVAIVSQWAGGGTGASFYVVWQDGGKIAFYYSTGGGEIPIVSTVQLVLSTWQHIAIMRSGNTLYFFQDGVMIYSSAFAVTIANSTLDMHVSTYNGTDQAMNARIDELRIQKGEAYFATGGFTPEVAEYSNGDILETPAVMDAASEVVAPTVLISASFTATVLDAASEVIEPSAVGDVVTNTPDVIDAVSEVVAPTVIISSTVTTSVLDAVSSVLAPTFPGISAAPNGTRILSYNPLLFVTNRTPAVIVKVDTSDPENITYESAEVVGIDNAIDASINETTGYIYVMGADGAMSKVEIADITTQTLFDFSDSDDLLTAETLDDYGITYAGTENVVGELYLNDERETMYMDTDLQVLEEKSAFIDIDFNAIEAEYFEATFTVLGLVTTVMNCDFKCLTDELDDITPMKRTDVHVYLDAVELGNTDVDLSSIRISHSVDASSTATFNLTRRHDRMNTDLAGNTRTITSQNVITIYLGTHLEFTGKISNLNCQYANDSDFITVTAVGDEDANVYNGITMSLPGLQERLSLYHVLVNNPQINNPYIDPASANPQKFKGILIDLGDRVEQSVSRFTNFDNQGAIAEKIQEGTFNPKQNWTYFWSPTLSKFGNFTSQAEAKAKTPPANTPFSTFTFPSFNLPTIRLSSFNSPFFNLGATSAVYFSYIGTSLAPVSEDLWIITNANHKYQRIRNDIITRLGEGVVYEGYFDNIRGYSSSTIYAAVQGAGYVGGSGEITAAFKLVRKIEDFNINFPASTKQDIFNIINSNLGYSYGVAPFKKVSARSGEFIPKARWEDRDSGLYSVTDAGFNFTSYVQRIAELEYQKLLNINGVILPDTSCQLDLTFDGYLYHDICLCTRVNIDNTTEANIFNGNNGFPVSVKGITIDTGSMKVTINADNTKSTDELEALDGLYPIEEDPQYNTPAIVHLLATKSDLRTGLPVE